MALQPAAWGCGARLVSIVSHLLYAVNGPRDLYLEGEGRRSQDLALRPPPLPSFRNQYNALPRQSASRFCVFARSSRSSHRAPSQRVGPLVLRERCCSEQRLPWCVRMSRLGDPRHGVRAACPLDMAAGRDGRGSTFPAGATNPLAPGVLGMTTRLNAVAQRLTDREKHGLLTLQ